MAGQDTPESGMPKWSQDGPILPARTGPQAEPDAGLTAQCGRAARNWPPAAGTAWEKEATR